jgi:hypothetical protein
MSVAIPVLHATTFKDSSVTVVGGSQYNTAVHGISATFCWCLYTHVQSDDGQDKYARFRELITLMECVFPSTLLHSALNVVW